MKLHSRIRTRNEGSTIVVVMLLATVGMVLAASIVQWSMSNGAFNHRNNEYFQTVSVAEAATEKVISRLARDYQQNGEAGVLANLNSYKLEVPTPQEDLVFARYRFTDAQGNVNRTFVQNIPPNEFRVLSSQYRGLRGYGTAFRIISNAKDVTSRYQIPAAVRQDVEAATIPLFQFMIFYNMDLEIHPGPDMDVTGPVHCNNNIYLEPQATLTFQGDITAAGAILNHKKPGDPSTRTRGQVVYRGEHDSGLSTLNLPIGTNNTPAAVRQVVEIPPWNESPTSPMGRERFYNKADLIIIVSNNNIRVTSGRANNFNTVLAAEHYNKFLTTNVSFWNAREGKTVRPIQIDVWQLREFNRTNDMILRPAMPMGDIRIVYVDDHRTHGSSSQPGVRLVNGETLLPQGLTVSTPKPLYIKGHYNSPVATRGTTNTDGSLPAAVIADAITILSPSWTDSKSSQSLSSRAASACTVNAAFLAGIVPTASGGYSGGVENFPRFLEDWSGDTFTYNGSMVVMYASEVATGAWRGTGSSIGIYNPPVRVWTFDGNFRTASKLPPGTPSVRAIIRGSWAMIRPDSTGIVNMY